MRIDQSMYRTFVSNPEKFRIHYALNISPAELGFGIQRGSAFHQFMDDWHQKISVSRTKQVCSEKGLSTKAVEIAEAMARVVKEKYPSDGPLKTLLTEKEFIYTIPGSSHQMVGKIDHVIELDGKLYVGDFKTSGPKRRRGDIEKSWENDVQADFYLIGVKTLGFETNDFLVRVVTETTPVNIWEIYTRRSNSQLELMCRSAHIICETINMLVNTFGINEPWPHFSNWPCDGGSWCEYRNICREYHETGVLPPGFIPREEHLDCRKEGVEVETLTGRT
jgi:hypothetical protein